MISYESDFIRNVNPYSTTDQAILMATLGPESPLKKLKRARMRSIYQFPLRLVRKIA
jgi:hypothetical protein